MEEILSPVDDWIFKLLFGDIRNKSILISFLKAFITLPDEEFDIILLDTHLKPESEDGKLAILDVKIRTKSGKIIDIEIQVNRFRHIGKRISYYKSKLIVEQIGKSQLYTEIQSVICIVITDYVLFPGAKEYIHRFRFYSKEDDLYFEDIPEAVYTIEIPKLPKESDGSRGWKWTNFLSSRKREEFEAAAQQDREIRKAVDVLYELSADEQVRALYDQRQKAWMDYNTLHEDYYQNGVENGIKIGTENGIKIGTENGIKIGTENGIKIGTENGIKIGVERVFELLQSGKTLEEAKHILGMQP